MNAVEFILYVGDQQKSRDFYAALLDLSPSLDVPGMTEFCLNNGCVLGLMPEKGIARILEPTLPHPSTGSGIPRCELYLFCEDPDGWVQHAIRLGAKKIGDGQWRDWGHFVAYCSDPDGHVLAFAKELNP